MKYLLALFMSLFIVSGEVDKKEEQVVEAVVVEDKKPIEVVKETRPPVIQRPELIELVKFLESRKVPQGNYTRYRSHNDYDRFFERYSSRFFGVSFDAKWFKAQAIIESNLRPDVTSPVGAGGIMQVMPGTWSDIQKRQPSIGNDRFHVENNIAAGIWYMSDIWSKWKFKETFIDHMAFCLASFNAGRGHIISAQRLAGNRNMNTEVWSSIERTLPEITGHHSKETINYVIRIYQAKRDLI